jgi:deferrochelatase/peroxidase EfeB
LTVEEKAKPSSQYRNDFDFVAQGGRCPFRGHIRRANPRGDIEGLEAERARRIVRRGITYGQRAADFSDHRNDGIGLLFMCYQSDIASHFEHMQREWCNWTFGFDSIIGQQEALRNLPPEAQNRNTEWPKVWASTAEEIAKDLLDWPNAKLLKGHEFGRYVTLQGGEYFFAPSIPFLQAI